MKKFDIKTIGLIAIGVCFIIAVVTGVAVMMSPKQIDVSNEAASEFYVEQIKSEETTEVPTEPIVEETTVEPTTVPIDTTDAPTGAETTQSPSEIAETAVVNEVTNIGNGLSEEEWADIQMRVESKYPESVYPLQIVEYSRNGIKYYDNTGKYYEMPYE